MEKLILHNYSHNGDIFYSRTLLKMLSKKYNIDYYISSYLKGPLLCDMLNVTEYYKTIDNNVIQYANDNNIKIIDAWIGQENHKYVYTENPGCSYENHFELAKIIANKLEIEISDNLEDYLPTVKYELISNYLLIKERMDILKTKFKTIVFISNGNVYSGQSENFDFTEIINQLAFHNNDVLFLTSQKIQTNYKNILYTLEITEIIPDLLQISYISTYCSVIVGRSSGPFCYTHTKENLTNSNKTFIAFSGNINEGIFYKNQKSKSIWSNNYNYKNILDTIQNNI